METIYQALDKGMLSIEKNIDKAVNNLVEVMKDYVKEDEQFRSARGIPFWVLGVDMLLYEITLTDDGMVIGYNTIESRDKSPHAQYYVKFNNLELSDKVKLLESAKHSFAELKVQKKV